MMFSANASVSGKMVVQITDMYGGRVKAYKMPNNFKNEKQTHGIFENGMIIEAAQGSSIQVPSDWTIVLLYEAGTWLAWGRLRVNSWVEQYSRADVSMINQHKPTGTSYQDSELIAQLARER